MQTGLLPGSEVSANPHRGPAIPQVCFILEFMAVMPRAQHWDRHTKVWFQALPFSGHGTKVT